MAYPIWHRENTRSYDVICMGRVAVDLYAEQIGVPLAKAETFKKYLGGCAGNIAVGTARLGLRTQMFSCVGTDAMGQFLKAELQKEGVDITLLKESSQHLTGLVLLGIEPPDKFPLIFYRNDCADMQLKANDITPENLAAAVSLVITGTGISTLAMREATHAVVAMARSVNTKVILDLDYRPVLWKLTSEGDGETRFISSAVVSSHYQHLLPHCDLIVGTEEEVMIAGKADDVATALATIRSLTAAPIVIKRGEKGASVYFIDQAELFVPTTPVKVLNVLGAGDAFMSGLLSGLLRGATWHDALLQANTCGGIVVTRHGCAPAMPYLNEIELCATI